VINHCFLFLRLFILIADVHVSYKAKSLFFALFRDVAGFFQPVYSHHKMKKLIACESLPLDIKKQTSKVKNIETYHGT